MFNIEKVMTDKIKGLFSQLTKKKKKKKKLLLSVHIFLLTGVISYKLYLTLSILCLG